MKDFTSITVKDEKYGAKIPREGRKSPFMNQ
jgi:hypothetical protein